MKFREFPRENTEKHAVLAFGRMNPPTTGHAVLVDKVHELAKKHGAHHEVILSHSQDTEKNPLSQEDKIKHAKRYFPNTNITGSTKENPNFISQAKRLNQAGHKHLIMVAGSDRVKEYQDTLKRYNGKEFNFKKIDVVSAGHRDPDAEGVSGMSASKMRGHAAAGNFKEFKKGIPAHVKHEHAKELYNDVRNNMRTNENLNVDFEHLLIEGVHDKGIFKAVFLAGGPGSGKDYVLDNTLAGHGLTEINSDKALEYLMDKEKLDKTMPDSEEKQRDVVRERAKSMTELRQRLALQGRNGLIINGTGDDAEKIKRIKDKLEKLGYDTSMIMVNTADEVSKQRNIERGMHGGRTVPEKIRKQKWDNVQASRPEFAKMFGNSYIEFDNSEDLRKAEPEVVKAKKEEMTSLFKTIQDFVAQKPSSENSKQWVANELEKKDTLPVKQGGAEKVPHQNSKAADQAKKLGLSYYGFGRYGKNGEVTYRSVHDELVQVQKQKTPNTNLKECYSFSDSGALNLLLLGNSIDEIDLDPVEEGNKLNKVKLMRDSNGKVRTFMLRRAAAKEAHQKNGTVMPYKNGYVIKINEENENVKQTMELVEQTGRTESGRISTNDSGSRISESRSSSSTGGSYSGTARKKITLQEIRKQKEKVLIESIDRGIEPGLSMASSGENFSRGIDRDMATDGKKYNRDSKKKIIKELTGDETTMSIGDKKEDELKKVGISLKTFKAKKFI